METPVFLPGEFHGQKSLAGYSPWGHKELDTTEQLHFHFHITPALFECSNYVHVLLIACMYAKPQSCLTLCDPIDCSLLNSSVHGILQATILEWVAMSSSGSHTDTGKDTQRGTHTHTHSGILRQPHMSTHTHTHTQRITWAHTCTHTYAHLQAHRKPGQPWHSQ